MVSSSRNCSVLLIRGKNGKTLACISILNFTTRANTAVSSIHTTCLIQDENNIPSNLKSTEPLPQKNGASDLIGLCKYGDPIRRFSEVQTLFMLSFFAHVCSPYEFAPSRLSTGKLTLVYGVRYFKEQFLPVWV